MCKGCWEEYGSPRIDSPAVRAAAGAIARVYGYNVLGGNLHVLVEDWNLGMLCEDTIRENVWSAGPAQLAAERACVEAMRGLTEIERVSALGLYEGYWEPDGWEQPGDWPEINGLVED